MVQVRYKKQIEEGGLPMLKIYTAKIHLPSIDRPTERQEESIMTGAQTIQPSNFTVSNSQKCNSKTRNTI